MITTCAIDLVEPRCRRICLNEDRSWGEYLEMVVQTAVYQSECHPLIIEEAQRWYVERLLSEEN